MRRMTGRKNQRGAAAVEFGLVLPVLLMILLGIIDYGWVFFSQLQMTNAVREGARRGVVQDTPAAATGVSYTTALNYLTAAGVVGSQPFLVITTSMGSAAPAAIRLSRM